MASVLSCGHVEVFAALGEVAARDGGAAAVLLDQIQVCVLVCVCACVCGVSCPCVGVYMLVCVCVCLCLLYLSLCPCARSVLNKTATQPNCFLALLCTYSTLICTCITTHKPSAISSCWQDVCGESCGAYLGLAKTIHIHTHVRCVYGNLSREITLHTVKYSVHIRFWLTLGILLAPLYLARVFSSATSSCYQVW